MRIIAGEARGRRLFAPEGMDTRPTTDRVRESLFGVLTPWLEDAVVLDLFSGSGALALEAVSRGARWAALCDKAPGAIRVIRRNVENTGFGPKVKVIQGDWTAALRRLEGVRFDLVFLDPPYRQVELYGRAAQALKAAGLLAPGAIIIMEHLAKQPPVLPAGFVVADRRRYGDTAVDLVREEEKGDAGTLSGQL